MDLDLVRTGNQFVFMAPISIRTLHPCLDHNPVKLRGATNRLSQDSFCAQIGKANLSSLTCLFCYQINGILYSEVCKLLLHESAFQDKSYQDAYTYNMMYNINNNNLWALQFMKNLGLSFTVSGDQPAARPLATQENTNTE
jgi:hypothetical protein